MFGNTPVKPTKGRKRNAIKARGFSQGVAEHVEKDRLGKFVEIGDGFSALRA